MEHVVVRLHGRRTSWIKKSIGPMFALLNRDVASGVDEDGWLAHTGFGSTLEMAAPAVVVVNLTCSGTPIGKLGNVDGSPAFEGRWRQAAECVQK